MRHVESPKRGVVVPDHPALFDARHRFLTEVTLIIRCEFRTIFGLAFANKYGHFVDGYLPQMIREFGYWVDYPRGNHVLFGHDKAVYAVVVSSDGRTLFTGSNDSWMIEWDLRSNTQSHRWRSPDRSIMCLAFHSGWLVSGSNSCIRVWKSHSHQLIHSLRGHKEFVWSVDFDLSGTRIVSSAGDKSVRVWSVLTGDCLFKCRGHSHTVTSAVFLGSSLISGGWDRSLRVWDASNVQLQRSTIVIDDIPNKVCDVCVNSNHSLIACLFGHGFLVYQWPTMKIVRNAEVFAHYGCFHPIKQVVLAVVDNNDTSVKIYDVKTGEYFRTLKATESLFSVCFTPDGFRLIAVSQDKGVWVWDTSRLRKTKNTEKQERHSL